MPSIDPYYDQKNRNNIKHKNDVVRRIQMNEKKMNAKKNSDEDDNDRNHIPKCYENKFKYPKTFDNMGNEIYTGKPGNPRGYSKNRRKILQKGSNKNGGPLRRPSYVSKRDHKNSINEGMISG